MSDTRPVWLSREMRNLLYVNHFSSIALAWDAAPADATEAVWNCIGRDNRLICEDKLDAMCLLRALGMPDS